MSLTTIIVALAPTLIVILTLLLFATRRASLPRAERQWLKISQVSRFAGSRPVSGQFNGFECSRKLQSSMIPSSSLYFRTAGDITDGPYRSAAAGNSLTIRPLTIRDAPRLVEMASQVAAGSITRHQRSTDRPLYLGAEYNGFLVGTVMAYYVDAPDPSGPQAVAEMLLVAKAWQGRGVGNLLLTHLVQEVRTRLGGQPRIRISPRARRQLGLAELAGPEGQV